jgi:hypothetical protein
VKFSMVVSYEIICQALVEGPTIVGELGYLVYFSGTPKTRACPCQPKIPHRTIPHASTWRVRSET